MSAKKLASTLPNMVIVLLTISLLSAAALTIVYSITKDRIAAAQEAKKLKAISEVLVAGYDNSPAADMFLVDTEDGNKLECYPAKKDGVVTSIAIKTYTKIAFSGEIWLMVGLLPEGSVNKISIIAQKETPGLGTKIDAPKFKEQYYGKDLASFNIKVKKDGGDVDAITAATISSRAFSDAVARAYNSYMNSTRK